MIGIVHSFETLGTVDGPGVRFVIFLQGCPMRCLYCHNPDSWSTVGKHMNDDDIILEIEKYKSYIFESGGVTISGGEPLLQLDFLLSLLTKLKAKGYHTCVDTSGVLFDKNDARYKKLFAVCDLFLVDLKHIDSKKHKEITKFTNKNTIDFILALEQNKKCYEIRYVLVPNLTDGKQDLIKMKNYIKNLKYMKKFDILPYHTLGKEKYKKLNISYPLEHTMPCSDDDVKAAKQILEIE